MSTLGGRALIWNEYVTACTTSILHTTRSRSPHNAPHSPSLMCTYTVVTHPCHISPLAQARPVMLCIYTSIIIYLPYVRRSVNAGWALLTRNIAHADPCGRKIENNAVLYSRALSLLTWQSEAPKTAREQEDRRWCRKRQNPTCCRDSRPEERKVEKLRVRDRASYILKLLVYIYIYILCVVRRAAYPKLIQFNARNVYKIRIVQTPRVLQWSRTAIFQQETPSHQGTEKTDCSVEESERELVVPLKPRNRERKGWECIRRARDRARRAAQTAEERDARLRQIHDNRRQSLATESQGESS